MKNHLREKYSKPVVLSVRGDVASVCTFAQVAEGEVLASPINGNITYAITEILSKRFAKGMWPDDLPPFLYECKVEMMKR